MESFRCFTNVGLGYKQEAPMERSEKLHELAPEEPPIYVEIMWFLWSKNAS